MLKGMACLDCSAPGAPNTLVEAALLSSPAFLQPVNRKPAASIVMMKAVPLKDDMRQPLIFSIFYINSAALYKGIEMKKGQPQKGLPSLLNGTGRIRSLFL